MQTIDSIVKDGYLVSPDFLAPLPIPSSEWQDWLEYRVKFRYELSDVVNFTAFKDNRNYWVAQKRIGGKLRQKRLGNSRTLAKLTNDQLANIALGLCAQNYNQQKRDRDPDYLAHQIIQLKTEIEHWKDKFYQTDRDRQALELKLSEAQSHGKTEVDSEANQERLSEATFILKQALKLKANAGGAIKDEIKRAIAHLEKYESQ